MSNTYPRSGASQGGTPQSVVNPRGPDLTVFRSTRVTHDLGELLSYLEDHNIHSALSPVLPVCSPDSSSKRNWDCYNSETEDFPFGISPGTVRDVRVPKPLRPKPPLSKGTRSEPSFERTTAWRPNVSLLEAYELSFKGPQRAKEQNPHGVQPGHPRGAYN